MMILRVAALSLAIFLLTIQAQDIAPISESEARLAYEQNTVDVIRAYGDSVVSVNVRIEGETMNPFENVPEEEIPEALRAIAPFLDETPVSQGSGSGFLIEVEGEKRLVSNFHVVQDALLDGLVALRAGASITVSFPSISEEIPVRVVGANPSFDLVLLAPVFPAMFPDVLPLSIANSDLLEVGQKAIAIGNPFGLSSTVTTGIVSALGRFVPSVGQINIPMIQTDAAINPGNSGGALLNAQGELIGINTALFNPEGRSFAGLGFAVPSNLLLETLANLELGGVTDISDTRPRLGIVARSLSLLPSRLKDALGLPQDGVVIFEVEADSPADIAGLKGNSEVTILNGAEFPSGGDVIVEVNGKPVSSADELNEMFTYNNHDGRVISFKVVNQGEERFVSVVSAN